MAAKVGDGRTEAAYEMRSGCVCEDEYEGRTWAFGVRHVIETAPFQTLGRTETCVRILKLVPAPAKRFVMSAGSYDLGLLLA
jgi:hypothetical protein